MQKRLLVHTNSPSDPQHSRICDGNGGAPAAVAVMLQNDDARS